MFISVIFTTDSRCSTPRPASELSHILNLDICKNGHMPN